jgi:hypothetical protein
MMRSMMLSGVSMTLLLGPRIRGARVKLEMGICKVKKTYRLIKLISSSLLMRTWNSMALSIVTILIKGWPPVVSVGIGWPVSTMTGGAGCSSG